MKTILIADDDRNLALLYEQELTSRSGPYCPYNHGLIDAHDAIMKSCNFYFIRTALQLTASKTVPWLSQSGFGSALLSWPDEQSAQRAWGAFRETPGHIHPDNQALPSISQLRWMAVGLGALDASVLQIANSIATIARNGLFIRPSLISQPAQAGELAEGLPGAGRRAG